MAKSITKLGWFTICSIIVIIFGFYFYFSNEGKQKNQTGFPVLIESEAEDVESISKDSDPILENPQAIKDKLVVIIPDARDTSQFGDKLEPIGNLPNTYYLDVKGSESLIEKQKEISQKPGVDNAEPDIYQYAVTQSEKPTNKKIVKFQEWQWNTNNIKAPEALKISTGKGTKVAILDTGIRSDHISLADSIDVAKGIDFTSPGKITYLDFDGKEKSCSNTTGWANDQFGHGTEVASIVGAKKTAVSQFEGIAPDTKIMPVRIANCGAYVKNTDVAKGIYYSVENGADVINISMSITPLPPYDNQAGCPTVISKAVEHAISSGVVVTAGSGNGYFPSPYKDTTGLGCPARIPGVIAVGASDKSSTIVGEPKFKWKSSFGKNQSVLAPGVELPAACACMGGRYEKGPNNKYIFNFGGTSGSTPHVSGVAALILSIKPNLTPDQVQKVIEKSASNPTNQNLPNERYGHGIVNAENALKSLFISSN